MTKKNDMLKIGKVRVIYQDLQGAGSKIGVIISQDSSFIQIQTINKKEFIPICKIIRMEEFQE